MFERALPLPAPGTETFFLWGPRQAGKSTLLRRRYPEARWVDLLKGEEFRRYLDHPEYLRQELETAPPAAGRQLVIDEIQKVPALLDEVHWLIENRGLHVALCGSSARKVRRGAAAYRELDLEVTHWRLPSGIEVDFVLGDLQAAVEAKASARVTGDHLRGLRALAQEHPGVRRFVVCLEPRPRRTGDGIDILPAAEFARLLRQESFLRSGPPGSGRPPAQRSAADAAEPTRAARSAGAQNR